MVGTTRRDGTVQLTPLWFEHVAGELRLNAGPRRRWLAHLRRDPRVTLYLADPANHHRWAQIQGRVLALSTEGGVDHIESLATRYGARANGAFAGQERTIVRIEPLRVTGEDGSRSWRP